MLSLLKERWIQHVKQNTVIYLVVLFVFITGIMTGTFTTMALNPQQKVSVGQTIVNFFNGSSNSTVNWSGIFRESFWQHLIMAFLIWIFGVFIWGSPFILILIGIRGFSFGFTIGFMLEHYKFGGFLFTLLCILPQSLVIVSCYIAMGIMALIFSLKKFQKRKIYFSWEQKRNKLSSYSLRMLISFAFLLLGILFEAYITPLLFPLFTWVFH